MAKSKLIPKFEAEAADKQAAKAARMRNRDKWLLLNATNLSMRSLLDHGVDMPVGAVAAHRYKLVGSYFASDQRLNDPEFHAERVSVFDSIIRHRNYGTPLPDTIGVSLEPCVPCQDFLMTVPSIKRVVFSLARKDASDRGLVRAHSETIFDRANRGDLPYDVVQLNDPGIRQVGLFVLNHIERDTNTGKVMINDTGLRQAFEAFEDLTTLRSPEPSEFDQ